MIRTPLYFGLADGRTRTDAGLVALPAVLVESPAVGWTGLEVTAVAAVVVAAAALAGWWGWKLVEDAGDDQSVPPELPEPAKAQTAEGSSPESSRSRAPDSGLHRWPTARAESDIEDAFLGSDDEMPTRQCPECDRKFPGVFDVCPFDSSTLEQHGPALQAGADERLPRRYCPDCGRRYELSADHCYHDGQSLRRDTDQASANAGVWRVCRDCGFETDEDLEACPEDGQRLVVLDPTRREQVQPAFPYNRCRQCGHVGAPDETKCPEDGSLMLPELDASMTALPPTGHGPRRCVCPDCGLDFAGHCNYCSRDGEQLIPLN